ncbi:hypothetical protein [Engelhardtia mirabilis]|uniref:Uncharacterized protein n=1 Tax=Engelhardtia mirabilis TaxID=2528011 RepID=A0A518BPN0_9BACT|nr:hypothetical protein Pla133_40440 [Planctomycetes bacterium Pla133]QDV03256.1 hypothetical protein Pla86_40430 [Planctomycetes bacterium Pla86]
MSTTREQRPWLPRFEPGQVVTAAALNQMADASQDLARFQARQFHGQGILFGLTGRLIPQTREWELGAGAAIDPLGRLIRVDKPQRVPVCSGLLDPREADAKHPHVADPGSPTENLTPVLFYRSYDVTDPISGATRREDSFEVQMVRGRVVSRTPDASRCLPLESLADLRAGDGSRLRKQFDELKARIHAEMSREQSEPFRNDTRRRLSALDLSDELSYGRPSARDVLTMAALNDIVYSLWQRARAQQYIELRGFDSDFQWPRNASNCESVEVGVPLGWLYRDELRAWRWDGRWRAGFALGLSRLELLGYSPRFVREVAADRVHALLRGLQRLRPFLPRDRDPAQSERERPMAWTLSPLQCDAGTRAWMRELRLDRPQRIASLWPLDPLRCSREAPRAAEPGPRGADSTAPMPGSGLDAARPAPSLIEPLNDPFTFCDCSEVERVDPKRQGLVALCELVGFTVAQVFGALAKQVGPGGARVKVASRPVSIADDEACEGLEFILLASFDEPLTIVTEHDSTVVLGFARAVTARARSRASGLQPEPQHVPFLRWLFQG